MSKINPYGSPKDFVEGEVITKKSFLDFASSIEGIDQSIDQENVRQEGLDARNFISGAHTSTQGTYQNRIGESGLDITIAMEPEGTWNVLRNEDGSPWKVDFNFTPENDTDAIVRCSGVISSRNKFFVPDSALYVDVGLLIYPQYESVPDGLGTTLEFKPDPLERCVWPYQRISLTQAYSSYAQYGYRKNVTDWRGYRFKVDGTIEGTGGMLLRDDGMGTDWMYDRKSYLYHDFHLLCHISSQSQNGRSHKIQTDSTSTRNLTAYFVTRINAGQTRLRGDTVSNFEVPIPNDTFQVTSSAHLDPKLSDQSDFTSLQINNACLYVQKIHR
mgnify:CR=1 FL=1